MSHPDDIHVLPINDLVDHEESGRECWCQPRVSAPCDQCEGVAACWKCGGTGDTDATEGRPAIISHNAADGRE